MSDSQLVSLKEIHFVNIFSFSAAKIVQIAYFIEIENGNFSVKKLEETKSKRIPL